MSTASLVKSKSVIKKQQNKKLIDNKNDANNLAAKLGIEDPAPDKKVTSFSGISRPSNKSAACGVRPKYLTYERINEIKLEVENAVKLRKTFYIYGHYRTIRKALTDRGWIEKVQVKNPKGKKLLPRTLASFIREREL